MKDQGRLPIFASQRKLMVMASSSNPLKTNALQPLYAFLRDSTWLAFRKLLIFFSLDCNP